jgi:hypothetical protein
MIDEEFDALDRDVEAELRRYDEITHLLTE